MKVRVKGLSAREVESVVINAVNGINNAFDSEIEVRDDQHRGNAYQFVLRLPSMKESKHPLAFRRVSHSGRNIPAVCYHGYSVVMTAILQQRPSAILKSGMARFDGIEDFTDRWRYVGDKNVGSIIYPKAYEDACNCDWEDTDKVHNYIIDVLARYSQAKYNELVKV